MLTMLSDTTNIERFFISVIATPLSSIVWYKASRPKGAQLCEQLISVFKRFSAHLYSSLAPQEKEVLINVFEKLIKSSQDYQL